MLSLEPVMMLDGRYTPGPTRTAKASGLECAHDVLYVSRNAELKKVSDAGATSTVDWN